MNALFKIMIFAFLLGFACHSNAQLLTIQDAVDQAIKNNAQINQMRAQLQQKQTEWRTQTGVSAPEISYMKEGIDPKASQPFQEQRWTVSQSVDFPLTMSYRLKAIREEGKAMEYSIQSEEHNVKAQVKTQYIEVIHALRLQQLRDQQLKLANDLYQAVQTQVKAGKASDMDQTKAELEIANAENDIDDARLQLHLARYELFNLMGLATENQKYSIQFMDSLRSTDVEISQIQALAVLAEQPSFRSSEKEMEAANYFLKEARSNLFPDIRFNLYKQDYGNGFNFNGFEVGLSFPIWLPLEQKGRTSMAVARQDEIRWKQDEIKLDMKKQIEHAWHSYEASRSTIRRYNQTIRQKADQLQTQTLSAYQRGEVDLLNLISTQQMYLDIQIHHLAAECDFHIQLVELEKFLNQDLVY